MDVAELAVEQLHAGFLRGPRAFAVLHLVQLHTIFSQKHSLLRGFT